MAKLICRVRNDGTKHVDVAGINDGDELSAAEALVVLLMGISSNLHTIARRLEDLR